MDSNGKICLALDTSKNEAFKIVGGILNSPGKDALGCIKIHHLIDEEATNEDRTTSSLFEALDYYNKPIWVDFKLHDIPRVVVARMQPYVNKEVVKYISVMAKGGISMMQAAVRCGGESTNVIAVTELTSLTEEDIHILSGQPSKASVISLARMAVLAGINFIVCSGHEVQQLKSNTELQHLKIIVPAVRPEWSLVNNVDQKRIITPAEALHYGVDMIVIGSPIVNASDPVSAFYKTVDEIEKA